MEVGKLQGEGGAGPAGQPAAGVGAGGEAAGEGEGLEGDVPGGEAGQPARRGDGQRRGCQATADQPP